MRNVSFIAAGLTMLLLLGCQSHPKQESQLAKKYELRGVVLEVYKDKHELRIKHEDVPGYMPGMTMNFPVRDDAALSTLAAGDKITANLNVAAPGDYWLSNIRKTASANPSR